MFENLLGQSAAARLIQDIEAGTLAPSMLFSGPGASGKGTAALETARILSCEKPGAPWACTCPSCGLHRKVSNPDMLLLGNRAFSAEAAASAAAFLREPSAMAGRLLFVRSARKLLARFNPVFWEDGTGQGKMSPSIIALEEDLDELEAGKTPGEKLPELTEGILKKIFKLEADGVKRRTPVSHIRRAAYWSRLAPMGKWKTIIIENADSIDDEGQNSLLKILEEPPVRLSIILTSAHPKALFPTILSRLRPYYFSRRDRETEGEVIRRIFRDPQGEAASSGSRNRLSSYLDSFLPLSAEKLYPPAAFFAASLSAALITALRRKGRGDLPEELVALGKLCAPIAAAAGLGRPVQDAKIAVSTALEGAGKFEVKSLFPRFLELLLGLVHESLRDAGDSAPGIFWRDAWQKAVREAAASVETYNQRPEMALERLFTGMCASLAEVL